ncbi:MAG: hypothetical protein ACRETN_11310 [Nevskiales bacterium]
MQAFYKFLGLAALAVLVTGVVSAAEDRKPRFTGAVDGSSPAICDSPCWVWVYGEPNFQGENDVLCGPFKRGEMGKMPNAHKSDWGSNIGSLRVGPRATLRVWEGDNFEGPSFFVEAGVAISNLEAANREQIESMELFCWKLNLDLDARQK